MEQIKRKKNWTLAVFCALVVFLAIDVVLLTLQNRELKLMLKAMTPMAQVEPLKTGEKVAPIVVQTLDGKISEISYTNPTKKYLLFVLSTTCPHCEKALISWRTISQSNTAGKCDIIGVSLHNLDATRKYLATKDVGFYTVSAASDTSFSRKYRITGVPETILIKGNGSVEKVWIGELTQDQTNEIQKLMTA
ncbi:MAG: TlpA family protein disulfide reductase [Ignavibacteria bacterium]|nr:MAG: TlpA family protein disulfide reductase [Ignavibacteria bacterium]